MIRRSVGGAILGLSLLVGSFAWAGFVALQTVFDPDRSREVGEELLDNDEVRAQVEENLAFAITSIIPPEVPVEDGVVEQVTAGLLSNPEVEASLLEAFTDTHRAFLGDGDVPERVDPDPDCRRRPTEPGWPRRPSSTWSSRSRRSCRCPCPPSAFPTPARYVASSTVWSRSSPAQPSWAPWSP